MKHKKYKHVSKSSSRSPKTFRSFSLPKNRLRWAILGIAPVAVLSVGFGVYAQLTNNHNIAYAQASAIQKDNATNQTGLVLGTKSDASQTPGSTNGSSTSNTKAIIKQTSTPAPAAAQAATPNASQPVVAASSNPGPVIPSLPLYANPAASSSIQAIAWAAANPGDATIMGRIANTPIANWFSNWSGDITPATNSYVSNATAAGALPVLIAYNIPNRDCGGYSSGGAVNASAYQSWINGFAAGIGQRQAVVVLEPDALAGMDCLTSTDQQTRLQLLTYAVQTLRSQTKAAIYLDAGNPTWQSTSTMASRLKNADIAEATGFSLNISNFQATASNVSYGNQISKLTSNKHFVIDTSRNGNGPTNSNAWCNPDGRAFGNLPTLNTGNAAVDAFLWLKNPTESDGNCGPGQAGTAAPSAGVWWPQYALMLARNSGW